VLYIFFLKEGGVLYI